MWLRVTYKSQTLRLQNASPHNSTWRRAEGRQKVNREGTRVLKLRWQGSTMQPDDGVINHPFSVERDFPWKPIMGCAEGLFDKRSLVKKCEKLNFKPRAGCQALHTLSKSPWIQLTHGQPGRTYRPFALFSPAWQTCHQARFSGEGHRPRWVSCRGKGEVMLRWHREMV